MKIAIVGGGTLGLTLALRLASHGHRITVLEAAPQIGGLATWFDFGEFTWDKYYHVVLRSDEALLGLFEELGVGPELQWRETKSGFLWKGRHLSMSSHWEFLRFPVLNLVDKLRLGLGILYCQRIRDPSALERRSAPEWMMRIFGRRVYEAIWEPLMESKYGVLTASLPATIMWSTITRYYSTRSKGDGKESMGYLSGGLKTFFHALESRIRETGGEIRVGQPVRGIRLLDSGRMEIDAAGESSDFDRVISTLPTDLLRKIAGPLFESVPAQLEHRAPPRFLGVIRVALVLRRPLSPFYVTNLIQKGFPFTGIIEVSSLVDREEFGGRSLVMLPLYDVPDSVTFERSDDELASEFIDGLRSVWPDIDENLVGHFVHREKRVQALWIDSPPDDPAPLELAGGRLWSINAELAGRDTLNNNAIVRVAEAAAATFLGTLD